MDARFGLNSWLKQDQDEEVSNHSIVWQQLNQSKSMLIEWTQNEKMNFENCKKKKWKLVAVMYGRIKSQFQKHLNYLILESDNSFRIFEILIKRSTQSQRFWIRTFSRYKIYTNLSLLFVHSIRKSSSPILIKWCEEFMLSRKMRQVCDESFMMKSQI